MFFLQSKKKAQFFFKETFRVSARTGFLFVTQNAPFQAIGHFLLVSDTNTFALSSWFLFLFISDGLLLDYESLQ